MVESGRCAFCDTTAEKCLRWAPAYCCANCCHPLLEVLATLATPTPPACSRCGQYVCQCTQGPGPWLAGPATPGCHECNGRGHTSVFSRDGYMTCDWCGGSGKEPETVAGSAAPSGDDDE